MRKQGKMQWRTVNESSRALEIIRPKQASVGDAAHQCNGLKWQLPPESGEPQGRERNGRWEGTLATTMPLKLELMTPKRDTRVKPITNMDFILD